MKYLPPQRLRESDWSDVEDQLKTIFYEIVFAPLMEIMRKTTPQAKELKEIMNAGGNMTSLLIAIRSGRVQYKDGVFSGDFSVAIAKDLRAFGATFDVRSEVYKCPVIDVPEFVKIEAARYQIEAKAAHEEMLRRLNEIQQNLEKLTDLKEINADRTIGKIEDGWKKSAKLLEVQPTLTETQSRELAKNYSENLKLYIRKFSDDSIVALRETVQDNAMEGYRFDSLIEKIRHRYGVTANKAKFLARQETSLFMSQYRARRFDQSGVRRYRWSTAHDERVRTSHRALNGRVFSYESKAPASYFSTGTPCNPGEDFNCRCVDIPLLEVESGQFAGNFS